MQKKIIVGVAAVGLLTAIASHAIAAVPGVYAGGQLGYGNIHESGFGNTDQGLAGRVFAGYQINTNFAAELGWARFRTADAKYNYSYTYVFNNAPITMHSNFKDTLKTNVVDLTAKGIYPVAQDFSLYGKLGGAYVIQNSKGRGVVNFGTPGSTNSNFNWDSTDKALYPTATIGGAYDLSPNLAADVFYTRIQQVGSKSIQSIDFAGAGLAYHFS